MASPVQRTVSVKLPHLEEAFRKESAKQLVSATPEVGRKLQADARSDHRYKHDTHRLEKSTKWHGTLAELKRGGKRGLTLKATAPYAKFIHGGFKSWQADPFLTKSLNKNRLYVFNKVKAAINKAIRNVNK